MQKSLSLYTLVAISLIALSQSVNASHAKRKSRQSELQPWPAMKEEYKYPAKKFLTQKQLHDQLYLKGLVEQENSLDPARNKALPPYLKVLDSSKYSRRLSRYFLLVTLYTPSFQVNPLNSL